MVAGDEGDEEAVVIAEAEDFRMADDVEAVDLVGFWGNVVADFVEDGGDFEKGGIVFAELVEF